jgi:hypothetical protein
VMIERYVYVHMHQTNAFIAVSNSTGGFLVILRLSEIFYVVLLK